MKSFLFLLLLLCIPKLAAAQVTENDQVLYIDSLGQYGSIKDYEYIRVIKDHKTNKEEPYQVREYYKSGKIALIGSIKSNLGFIKMGTFLSFYENGNKKSIKNYKENELVGSYFEFYEKGDKKLEAEDIIAENKLHNQQKIKQFWDSTGIQKVIDGNGFFEDQDGNEYSKGEIKNGFKEGNWVGSLKKLHLSYKETYKYGKLVSGESIEGNGETHTYKEVEIAPEPRNGIGDFYNFIGRNYRAPNKEGLKGKVYITFVIDKKGRVVEPKVSRDLGYGTGEEAIRVVTKYDGFRPGEQRGRKVRCTYFLPISIQSAY